MLFLNDAGLSRNTDSSDSTEGLEALWSRYCRVDAHAQRTGLAHDHSTARAAWHRWLCAFIPDAAERAVIPAPRHLRGA